RMEGTESKIVPPPFPELDVLPDHIEDIHLTQHLIYDIIGDTITHLNHGLLPNQKKSAQYIWYLFAEFRQTPARFLLFLMVIFSSNEYPLLRFILHKCMFSFYFNNPP